MTKLGGDSPSLSSSSAAVVAPPPPLRYKCKHCSRRFRTSRARCSHQLTHRMAREMRLKPYGAVLGAVLIHHIPSDDEEEVEEITGPPPPLSSAESAPTGKLEPKPEQGKEEVFTTKDLLGEWSPMHVARAGVVGEGSSAEESIHLNLDLGAGPARVSKQEIDDVDLELKLSSSKRNEKVDLELKLGF